MLDHKLTIFYHTAKHLNTTKAAEILRLLSSTYKCNFLGADNKQ